MIPGGEHGNPFQYSCLENPHGQKNLDLIPLVVKENRVLVIGGHAVSEDAKVQPGQQLALRIEVKEQE